MTKKEELLAIDNYAEFDKRRAEFRELPLDNEIIEHLSKLFPKLNLTYEELYKTPPIPGKKRVIGQ